ncbi:hypothetical protein [Aeromicrobium alkaliterrae]|uniref:Uncharacterized protein n=1 Tax=Aeromicrobium alkaliterrae TaxID=302168 RepID=A0ABN2JEV0_9ACTN
MLELVDAGAEALLDLVDAGLDLDMGANPGISPAESETLALQTIADDGSRGVVTPLIRPVEPSAAAGSAVVTVTWDRKPGSRARSVSADAGRDTGNEWASRPVAPIN